MLKHVGEEEERLILPDGAAKACAVPPAGIGDLGKGTVCHRIQVAIVIPVADGAVKFVCAALGGHIHFKR